MDRAGPPVLSDRSRDCAGPPGSGGSRRAAHEPDRGEVAGSALCPPVSRVARVDPRLALRAKRRGGTETGAGPLLNRSQRSRGSTRRSRFALIARIGYADSCNSELRASVWTAMRFTTDSSALSVRRKCSPSSRGGCLRPNAAEHPGRRPLHVRMFTLRSPMRRAAPRTRADCSKAGFSD